MDQETRCYDFSQAGVKGSGIRPLFAINDRNNEKEEENRNEDEASQESEREMGSEPGEEEIALSDMEEEGREGL